MQPTHVFSQFVFQGPLHYVKKKTKLVNYRLTAYDAVSSGRNNVDNLIIDTDIYLFTSIGFPPGGSGQQTCIKMGKRQHKMRNKPQNNTKTKNRKQKCKSKNKHKKNSEGYDTSLRA